jgi:hypothetical protein
MANSAIPPTVAGIPSAAGNNKEIQYNSAGILAAIPGFTYSAGVGKLDVLNGYQLGTTDLGPHWSNGYAQNQNITGTELLLTGSTITIPTGIWAIGGCYHTVFDLTKTAAGTGALAFTVRMGTTGTVGGDAAIVSFPASAAGTAAVDIGIFDIYVTFKVGGAACALVVHVRATKQQTTTGLINNGRTTEYVVQSSSTFDCTGVNKISVGLSGGASFVGSISFIQTTYTQ